MAALLDERLTRRDQEGAIVLEMITQRSGSAHVAVERDAVQRRDAAHIARLAPVNVTHVLARSKAAVLLIWSARERAHSSSSRDLARCGMLSAVTAGTAAPEPPKIVATPSCRALSALALPSLTESSLRARFFCSSCARTKGGCYGSVRVARDLHAEPAVLPRGALEAGRC